jgi:transcriptional regulator with XRE-family HTH domain
MLNQAERQALGAFLRTQRARVQPTEVGLPAGQRRKTPGLRREEIAYLAGISVTWYTWIEQGREVRISDSVLESLARVLNLSPHERAYLLRLANGNAIPVTRSASVSPHLQRILDHQGICPAYIMGPFWDVVAWNHAAAQVFGDWSVMNVGERNMMWYTFARQETRLLVVDWTKRARRLLAEFRSDCGQLLGDPGLVALIDRLRNESHEFAIWWEDHEVQPRDGGERDFDHPIVGRLRLQQTTLQLHNHPELKVVLLMPVGEADQTAKLQMLHASDWPRAASGSGER